MRLAKILVLVFLPLFFEPSRGESKSEATSIIRIHQIFIGMGHCNRGEISTNVQFRGCQTRSIGFTIDKRSAVPLSDFSEIYAGDEVINQDLISSNPNFLGGSTKSLGFLSKKRLIGGTKIYRGVAPCSGGSVTLKTQFGGCRTIFFGYSVP